MVARGRQVGWRDERPRRETSPVDRAGVAGTAGDAEAVLRDERVDVISDEANAFLSNFLNKKCQLVTMPSTTDRRVDEKYNRGNDVVSFADGYPFLIIGEASLEELNKKVSERKPEEAPLSMRRFRTNFIFSGGQPFEEDLYQNFKIGVVDFVGVKPCARCVLTTRDPDTGTKGKEPLDTLAQFRQLGNKILFGQNVVWDDQKWQSAASAVVKVGDMIYNTTYNTTFGELLKFPER